MKLNRPELIRDRCLIGGRWTGEPTAPVEDPSTGKLIGLVPNLGTDEAHAAIAAADVALRSWPRLLAKERSTILRRWFDAIMASQEDLATILTWEQGKPISEARGEIGYAASFIEWFAEEAKRTDGMVIPSHRDDARLIVIKQPVGVTAAITPWNFPAAMITRKAAPALAAGCTMVVKPAMQTPLTALALAKLGQEAGIPDGVLNVITGDAAGIGQALTDSPTVRKLSFTGSTGVGRVLLRQCADTVKRVSMELGGNAPFIIFEDADIDAAVAGAMASKYRNSGQTCVCANRFYVHGSVAAAFEEKFAAAVRGLIVGNGMKPDTTQGPLIDAAAIAKVEEHVADAVAKGARVVIGGKRHAAGSLFFEPTILMGCTTDMLVGCEETFGPVAPVFTFEAEAEVIELANASEVGLAGYFYTRDLARAWRVGEALECGMVGINTGLISTEVAPFGGVKQSGIGREGARGGIDEYLEEKYLCMAGL